MKNTANYRNGKTAKEVYFYAKEKAQVLENKQMIRLFADADFAYWIYKEDNVCYVGSFLNNDFEKEMKDFFKTREVIYLADNKTGVKTMKFQKL